MAGVVTMTLLYTGVANATALKTAVDGQAEGSQADSGKLSEIVFIPMTNGQVAVWLKARAA